MEIRTMKQEAPAVPHLYSWLLASAQVAEGMPGHVSHLFSANVALPPHPRPSLHSLLFGQSISELASLAIWDRLRVSQIIKSWFFPAEQFFPQFICDLWNFTVSSEKKPGCTFSPLLGNPLS